MKILTKYQDDLPCDLDQINRTEKSPSHRWYCGHKACFLWNTGWRVGVKKFLWFKWLEFTK
jgi:hypothetical protein